MTNGPSRVVLITGASSGIGRATAELLAGRGYRVFGGVRAPATTSPLAGVELMPLDVRDEASVKACVEEVRSRAGRIDVLINNAGVNLVGAVEETSIGQAQALFDTNVVRRAAHDSSRAPRHAASGRRPDHQYQLDPGLLAGAVHGRLCEHQACHRRAVGIARSRSARVRHPRGLDRAALYQDQPRRERCASGGSDRRLCGAAPPHGGSDHPQHQHGARAEGRRRGSVAIDRRALPHATADRPGSSPELAAQAAAGRDCSSPACARHSRSIHRARAPPRNRALNPEGQATCSISSAWSSRRP